MNRSYLILVWAVVVALSTLFALVLNPVKARGNQTWGYYNSANVYFYSDGSAYNEGRYAWDYYNSANAYYNKGQYDQAILDYNKAIEIDPRFAQAYSNRGNAYGRKGLYDKAIIDYTKAIEISPKFGKAYVNLGYIWHLKGDNESSCFFYEKACILGYCRGYEWAKKWKICQ